MPTYYILSATFWLMYKPGTSRESPVGILSTVLNEEYLLLLLLRRRFQTQTVTAGVGVSGGAGEGGEARAFGLAQQAGQRPEQTSEQREHAELAGQGAAHRAVQTAGQTAR